MNIDMSILSHLKIPDKSPYDAQIYTNMHSYIAWYSKEQFSGLQYSTVEYSTIQYSAVQYRWAE